MERAVSVQRGGAVGDSAENGCAGDDVAGPHSLLFWVYRPGAGVVQHGRKNQRTAVFILRGGGIYPYQKQKEIFSQNLWHCGGNGPDFISDEGVWSFCESRWFLSCERGDGGVCNFNGYVAGNGLDWGEKASERNLCAVFTVCVVFRRGGNLLSAFYASGSGGGFFESHGGSDT